MKRFNKYDIFKDNFGDVIKYVVNNNINKEEFIEINGTLCKLIRYDKRITISSPTTNHRINLKG